MKGRDYADGPSQKDYITKEELSSPNVSLYALMGSCVMDALDDRKVITIDILGAFLQGEWLQDKNLRHIMFEGIMVEMICEIDTSYHKNVIWSKDGKKKFLYGRLVKAVYNTLIGAIMFYN